MKASPFFFNVRSLLLGLALALAVFLPPTIVHAAPADQNPKERRAKLLAAAENENPLLRRRALQELEQLGTMDEAYGRALVKSAEKADAFEAPRLACALARAGTNVVPLVLAALQSGKADDGEAMLLALGRMGPAAKSAIPTLKRMLAGQSLKPERQMALHLVLTAIGDDPGEHRDFVLRGIKPQADESEEAVGMVALMGLEHWPGKEIALELIRWLDGKSEDGSAFAAAALASLGPKALQGGTNLVRVLQKLGKEEDSPKIIYGLALARIQPAGSPERKEALADMLRYLSKAGNHTDWFALSFVSHTLMDADLTALAVAFLKDPDFKLNQGAMRLLGDLGAPSKEASDAIVALYRKHENWEFRGEAARWLGFLLPASEAATLENLLVGLNGTDPWDTSDVREGLRASLAVVTLGEKGKLPKQPQHP